MPQWGLKNGLYIIKLLLYASGSHSVVWGPAHRVCEGKMVSMVMLRACFVLSMEGVRPRPPECGIRRE